jgi:hypothetical protein
LSFQFLKVELRNHDWRSFIESDNPVAAALLAKMGYNKREERNVRMAYLRMLLRLRNRWDDGRLALIMSVADLYFKPDIARDRALLAELKAQYPEEGESLMQLMPAWKKVGYDEGLEVGKEAGREEGREEVVRKLLQKGFTPEQLAETIDMPIDHIRKLLQM